jgi:hypothetical protein
MSDDALWNTRIPRRCKPRPDEPLWRMSHNHHAYAARLRYHNEYGVETQILRDGDVLVGRRFPTRAQAVLWAEEERESREAKSARENDRLEPPLTMGWSRSFKENS